MTGIPSSTWLGAFTRSLPEQAADQCPDANLVAAFAERNLVPVELNLLWQHLAECGACRTRILFAASALLWEQESAGE